MDFKLNDDKNKLHLQGFTLKLLLQNQSKRLPTVASRSDIASKMCFHSYMGCCPLNNLKNLIFSIRK